MRGVSRNHLRYLALVFLDLCLTRGDLSSLVEEKARATERFDAG